MENQKQITKKDFEEQRDEILRKIPFEFHWHFTLATQKNCSLFGYEQALIILDHMVNQDFEDALTDYVTSITNPESV